MKLLDRIRALTLTAAVLTTGWAIAQTSANPARVAAAAKATGLPKDIYPDQLARVPLVKRESLSDADKKVYDALDSEDYKDHVGIWSPAGDKLNAPGFSPLEAATNSYFRKSRLGGAEYELATLIVSREMNCQVMWTAHEPQALQRGVSQQAIDVIKFSKPLSGLPDRDATIIQLGREIFEKDLVSSETYARAEKLLGRDGLVILTSIIGYRTAGVQTVRVFDQRLNPNMKPLLPMP